MKWIRINLNTLKAFIRKQNINNVKVRVDREFDGMTDGSKEVNKTLSIPKDELIQELRSQYTTLYLTEDELITCNNFETKVIIDDRFKQFITEIKTAGVVDML